MTILYDLGINLLAGLIGFVIGIPVTYYFIEPLLEKRVVSKATDLVRFEVEHELWKPLKDLATRAIAVAKAKNQAISQEQLRSASLAIDGFLNQFRARIPSQLEEHLVSMRWTIKVVEEIQESLEKHEAAKIFYLSFFPKMLGSGIYKLFDELIAAGYVSRVDDECPKCGKSLSVSASHALYCSGCQCSFSYSGIFSDKIGN
jgi:hypothetical protein